MSDLISRKMAFEIDSAFDPVFIEGQPEMSYFTLGVSLMLFHVEPYLIRQLKKALPVIADEALYRDVEQFCKQEAQHYKQHEHINEVIRQRGYPHLAELESKISEEYEYFSKHKSLAFNLAYVEGFEAATANAAVKVLDNDYLGDVNSTLGDMLNWHLCEEIEHRTVAFDVLEHICGSYFYRVTRGGFGQYHFFKSCKLLGDYLYDCDRAEIERQFGDKSEARKRLLHACLSRRDILPGVLKSFLPWYSPHKIVVSEKINALTAHYTDIAVSTS